MWAVFFEFFFSLVVLSFFPFDKSNDGDVSFV